MPVLLFNSTHHALSAEDLLEEEGFAIDTVPAPESVRADCGLAIKIDKGDIVSAGAALNRARIEFQVFEE